MFMLTSLKASGFKRLDLQDKMGFPDGRMLVHGRNESGKSTILEAIHYALYGFALRPTKRAGKEDLICYGKSSAVIELEFSIDDAEYQIRRELKRKGSNVHILNRRDGDGSLSRVTRGATAVNSHILEILHGIDSDALLNSCLVEQKELGKLEASNKQDRIKAMSSLLNLEEFIDARDSIRKDRSNLDKTHSGTMLRLQEAKRASEAYTEAETRKTQAEKRLVVIGNEMVKTKAALEGLEKDLDIISEMKETKARIDSTQLVLNGKQDERKIIEASLEEANRAQETLKDLEQQILEAEILKKSESDRLAALDELIIFDKGLNEGRSELRLSTIKLEDATKKQSEAQEATDHLVDISAGIEEYTPAKAADETLSSVIGMIRTFTEAKSVETRIQTESEEAHERLAQLSTSESTINRLSVEEDRIEKALKSAQQNKIRSVGAIGFGVACLVAYSINVIFVILGVILLSVGAYLTQKGSSEGLNEAKKELRAQRECIIGDIARINEYSDSIKDLQRRAEENREEISEVKAKITKKLKDFPRTPRAYSEIFNLKDIDSIEVIRSAIQEDLRQLARLETDKQNIGGTAEKLDQLSEALTKTKDENVSLQKLVNEFQKEIVARESASGVTLDQQETIREAYSEATMRLTELTSTKTQVEENLKRKPELEASINSIDGEIKELTVQMEEFTITLDGLREEHGLEMGDERGKQDQKEAYIKKTASLETEENQKKRTITESTESMERTSKLQEEYPVLVEEAEGEEFRLEAMRRAVILLDTTRDGIMGSIKTNVEKNMMQFMPTLTGNRYSMARIDEERYIIEVYDREAKNWRGKGVFSGATQDQFSLALRLAFAISTIPNTRGARPGFIFLDEPLSGFDTQRREGFMLLLREELSKHFQQIIVISHIEALRDEFHHHISLESGRIVKVQR
jgi:exonuclease SbcC